MTGPEHYREAEKALEVGIEMERLLLDDAGKSPMQAEAIALLSSYYANAQVHATLALAAATIDHPAFVAENEVTHALDALDVEIWNAERYEGKDLLPEYIKDIRKAYNKLQDAWVARA